MKLLTFFLRFTFESNLVNLNNFFNNVDKRIRRVTDSGDTSLDSVVNGEED